MENDLDYYIYGPKFIPRKNRSKIKLVRFNENDY